jgi:D-glycero-D-manno-heptose 1,7-bisphosphate phosphatase
MPNKFVFLDRDGILIKEVGDYNYLLEKIEFLYYNISFFKHCASLGYQFVVITNQSGVSKGIYGHKDVERVHKYISTILSEHQINILDYYYCPHSNVVTKCLCRKPDSLMLEKAIAKYNADKDSSWFIGDAVRDAVAAKKAGVNPLLVPSNADLNWYKHIIK